LIQPMHLAVNMSGIPHLAKNERDMGTRPWLGNQEFEAAVFSPGC
jgi:hypothetical protein